MAAHHKLWPIQKLPSVYPMAYSGLSNSTSYVTLWASAMFKSWSGQVALVSGAGSEHGIGLAIARRLRDSGAKLIITGSSARSHMRHGSRRRGAMPVLNPRRAPNHITGT